MARIQVLELPLEVAGSFSMRPCILVIDQASDSTDQLREDFAAASTVLQIPGVRAVVVFADTMDVT